MGAPVARPRYQGRRRGSYARELTEAERAQQQQALEDAIKGFDVVITTARSCRVVPPRLVTAAAVEGMKPGSVVVDLAEGETGGNCELTEPGQTVVKHDVTIASGSTCPPRCPSTQAAVLKEPAGLIS